ncbi:YfcL family protein [Photobacterium carnosum]|uniref:YfcL family protein n=1 Tax=Photobacterium carnosum TaxID=2023717 RepID=UPI001E439599|nr:YfcL family protein [Photobacterium carnosum]MCD9493524.1 YfcL family protein [Photobacterium carnosum]MCD9547802.1 YfcL family protein [Photobacterium carnosum]MCF2305640.1 YfcL family protein [Photobacterium carnosum]
MIHDYEQKLLQLIDDNIDSATDDELFAGGYLRGHISLAAADCEQQGIDDIIVMQQKVKQSLQDAKSELSPSDWQLVQQYSDKLMA